MSNYFEVRSRFGWFILYDFPLGDAPIKAIEFDGYMVLKNTLNGDRIPICRVEDLEITLVSPDLPVRVRLPTKDEHQWRSLSEVRAAEVQCMQLALALLARHESEMYVTIEADRHRISYLQSNYNQHEQTSKTRSSSTVRKHLEECERIFPSTTKISPKVRSRHSSDRTLRQNSVETSGTRSSIPFHAPSDRYYRTSDEHQSRKSLRHVQSKNNVH